MDFFALVKAELVQSHYLLLLGGASFKKASSQISVVEFTAYYCMRFASTTTSTDPQWWREAIKLRYGDRENKEFWIDNGWYFERTHSKRKCLLAFSIDFQTISLLGMERLDWIPRHTCVWSTRTNEGAPSCPSIKARKFALRETMPNTIQAVRFSGNLEEAQSLKNNSCCF